MKRLARFLLRWLLRAGAAVILLSLTYLIALRWVNPPTTLLMQREAARLGTIQQSWVPMEQIAAEMARAAVAAEDARFCQHWGIDITALRQTIASGSSGGASTISQQVAKNVFLWPERSWIRKALEVPLTLGVEAIWPKRRILEVYLNIAELGPGIFGVEAAAKAHFGRSAARLSLTQSARLAAILPAPKSRDPNRLSATLKRRAARIADGARTLSAQDLDTCI